MTDTFDPAGPAYRRTVALPADWPSPWPHLYRPVRDRAAFVLTVMVLTTIGLVTAGDPAAQWWAIALPLLLLIGPATKPARVRRGLQRAVRGGRVRTLPGQLVVAELPTTVWLRPATGDPELPLHIGPAEPAMRRYVDSAATLVWVRRRGPAAVVLPDLAVVYLVRPPGGMRAAAVEAASSDESGWTLPTRH